MPEVGVALEDTAILGCFGEHPGVQRGLAQGAKLTAIPMRDVLAIEQVDPTGFIRFLEQFLKLGRISILRMELLQVVRRLEHDVVVRDPGVEGGDERAIGLAELQLKVVLVDDLQLSGPIGGAALGIQLRGEAAQHIRVGIDILEGEADVLGGQRLAIRPAQAFAQAEGIGGVII